MGRVELVEFLVDIDFFKTIVLIVKKAQWQIGN